MFKRQKYLVNLEIKQLLWIKEWHQSQFLAVPFMLFDLLKIYLALCASVYFSKTGDNVHIYLIKLLKRIKVLRTVPARVTAVLSIRDPGTTILVILSCHGLQLTL